MACLIQATWTPRNPSSRPRCPAGRRAPPCIIFTRPAQAGKYDDAIGEARRSLAGDADRPETLAVLGEAFLKKGDDRMAAFYWKWYSDRNPNALDGCLALIELYERQKEEEELSRAVGKMLVLKGSKSLDNLIDEMRKNKYVIHVPDREKITATVKKCLDGRCLRP